MKFITALSLLATASTVAGFSPAFITKRQSTTSLDATGGKLGCRAIGIGSAAPKTTVTNSDLESVVETSDEWIATRTGIRQRNVLLQDETLISISVEAGRKALEMSGKNPEDIDLVICATSSADDLFGDATSIARELGCTNAFGFDLTAACSGFLFSVVTAGQFLENGAVNNVLVLGADALSRWTDWDDRNTCILFGDGAGAMVLSKTEDGDSPGVLGYATHSDGGGYEKLNLG